MNRKTIAAIALLAILVLTNFGIYQREQHLSNGAIIYIELAPVDPRSIIQGDYMALRFDMSGKIRDALRQQQESFTRLKASKGYVVVNTAHNGIASYKQIYSDQPLAEGDRLVRYRIRNGKVIFATNAFFFQEGEAEIYQSARYGEFRIDDHGELLLTALSDKELKRLGSSRQLK